MKKRVEKNNNEKQKLFNYEKVKYRLNNTKGITLIALVITIKEQLV